jgi:hypothetical protein
MKSMPLNAAARLAMTLQRPYTSLMLSATSKFKDINGIGADGKPTGQPMVW